MVKTAGTLKLALLVASCSIASNLSFVMELNLGMGLRASSEQDNDGWTRRAAEEAEAVASTDCSGHGRAYLDGFLVHGKAACECNMCYGGHDCSEFSPDCPANADSGDPLFLEPYWREHAASSAVLVPGWHRMGYSYTGETLISEALEGQVRKLHAVVGNADTNGKFILFGAGSTQLLYAAVHALSHDKNTNTSSPVSVVAKIPYYNLFETQTDFFDSRRYDFLGDAAVWKNRSDSGFIEFVTSPNNPDDQLNQPLLKGPNVKTIHDRAYFWPHFTAIPASPPDEDLTIFSTSKLTGHAGSRVGWALIKDKGVYERMANHLLLNTIGVSRDSQLRSLKLLKVVLEDGGRGIFEFGYGKMKSRWQRLRSTVSLSNRFTLQKVPSQDCTFFQELMRESTPAYAWVKCEWEKDQDCLEVMRAANIIGRGGALFKADKRYVRLRLIRGDDDFDHLVNRLHKLISREERRG